MAQIDEEELVPGCEVRMRAGLLCVGRKERNVKKLKTAVIDSERNDGLTLKLTETSQILIAVEQDELFDGKFSVAQDLLISRPLRVEAPTMATQGLDFPNMSWRGTTSCRQGWEKVGPRA